MIGFFFIPFAVSRRRDLVRNIDPTLARKASGKASICIGVRDAIDGLLQAVADALAVSCGLSQAVERPDPSAATRVQSPTVCHVVYAWGQIVHHLAACHSCHGLGSTNRHAAHHRHKANELEELSRASHNDAVSKADILSLLKLTIALVFGDR